MRKATQTASDITVPVEFDEKKIDSIFTELDQCRLPGAAIGIAIGGKPVYRKGFGLASMELPVALSPTMRMRIGSTSKHFACLAYMLLCEEGKAGIDDLIGKYLPELHPVTHHVTFRQLMGHLSGLRDPFDISWTFSGTGQAVSSAELLSLYRDMDDVNAAPGTAWIYSNGGFLLLSVAIERITDQPLEEVLRERIFTPVGMYDTLLRRFDSDFVPNSATLHTTNPQGGFEKSYLGTASAGDGGVVSTVDDMLRWLSHMDAPVVGSPATWQAMKAPQVLANGISTGYGLGLMTDRYHGVETLSHSGGVMGGNSQMLKVPSAGLDVAIMVNRHDVLGILLVDKILDVCLPGLAAAQDPIGGPFATGTFRSSKTGRVIQAFAKNGQQIVSIDGTDWAFVSGDDHVLHPRPSWGTKQAVTLIGNLKSPASIRYSDFGKVDDLVPVQPVDEPCISAIAGQYRSDATGTDVTIDETDDGARMTTMGRFGSAKFGLECLADGIWRARFHGAWPPGGILSFDGDGKAFRYSSSRTRALTFRRSH